MPESEHARALLVWFRNFGPLMQHGLCLTDEGVIAAVSADVDTLLDALEHGTYGALVAGRDAALRLYRLAEQHAARNYIARYYEAYEWMCQQLAAFALLHW